MKAAAPILFGFIVGAVFWLPPFVMKGENQFVWLILALVEPLVGIILAVVEPTRKFGLGVLLASGLGWLVLGAMCSGMLR